MVCGNSFRVKSESIFLIYLTCSQEAVDIVQSYIHLGATFACQQLIQTAATRWQEEEGDYRDDVSEGPSLSL